jgi:hypothetical protein
MICEDCVHHDLCFDNGTLFINFTTTGRKAENVETNCPFKNFKNKADFVEVKHGEWEKAQFVQRSGFRTVRDYICSICGKVYAIEQPCNLMNYCPHCGAKMDGRSDT